MGAEHYEAYLYEPTGHAGAVPFGACVVLLPEIFGLTLAMETQAAYWTDQGFQVAVPDIFWRRERHVSLGYEGGDRDKAFSLYQGFDHDQAVGDISCLVHALKKLKGGSGHVGVVGYCFGGTLAWLLAARTDIEFAVAFYGTRIHDYLGEAGKIACPTSLHFGTSDAHVQLPVVERIHAAASENPLIQVHIYQGAAHAFMNESRPSYDAGATSRALASAMAFAVPHMEPERK